jgi:hypothetical protein
MEILSSALPIVRAPVVVQQLLRYKLRGLSSRENYTTRETAACRRS